MNEELLKEIKGMLPWLLAAGIAVGGYYGIKNYRVAQKEAASAAFVNAYTAEELEEAVAKFGSSATGGALRLRLAKKYFDGGRAQEALDIYADLDGKAPAGFDEIPAVGKAQCLEALGRFDEAVKAFDAFAEANPKSCLALSAKLGAARAVAQAGDKEKALARLAALKDEVKDDEIAKARVEATEDCVRRYVKK